MIHYTYIRKISHCVKDEPAGQHVMVGGRLGHGTATAVHKYLLTNIHSPCWASICKCI